MVWLFKVRDLLLSRRYILVEVNILHGLNESARVLQQELHRVLKPGGTLSVSDHHLRADKIIGGVTR